MADTMTVRLNDDVRRRLRARARERRETPTALAQRLIDEGLRMDAHPGIVFRSTSLGGRIPGLARGPDVVEVVRVLQDLDATGEEAIGETCEWLGLTPGQVRLAIEYYAAFPDEIDEDLQSRREAADESSMLEQRVRNLLG